MEYSVVLESVFIKPKKQSLMRPSAPRLHFPEVHLSHIYWKCARLIQWITVYVVNKAIVLRLGYIFIWFCEMTIINNCFYSILNLFALLVIVRQCLVLLPCKRWGCCFCGSIMLLRLHLAAGIQWIAARNGWKTCVTIFLSRSRLT